MAPAAPDGYFTVRENQPDRFSLERMEKFSGVLIDEGGTPLGELMDPIGVLGGLSLLHVMNGKLHQTHVYKVISLKRHGRPKGYTLNVSCWVNGYEADKEIDFNDRWLITRETGVSTNKEIKGLRVVREISYTTFDERILPLHITIKRFDPSVQVNSPPFVADFKNYRRFKGSPVDFSLAQFGLPEPGARPAIRRRLHAGTFGSFSPRRFPWPQGCSFGIV